MKKSSVYLKTLSLTLSAGLVMSASSMATASLQPSFSGQQTTPQTLLAQRRSRLGFKVQGVQTSFRRTGGVSRGTGMCYGEEISVTPLVPQNNPDGSSSEEKISVQSTVVPNPTFYVYVSQTKAEEATFTLLNEKGDKILHEKTVSLADNTPGIVSVSLPEDANLLEENQIYHWFLSVQCDPNDSAGNMIVEGWVKRLPMDNQLENALLQADNRDRPAVYADYGIWTESLSSLVELRERYPNDPEVEADWQSLLESVNLGAIADEPLISLGTGVDD